MNKPTISEMKLALNQHGMYSPLEKAAMAVPRQKGTHAEFMAEVSKQPGFRAEEVADRRISAREGKMTKAEFLEHLKKHPAPRIQEKVFGGKDYEDALDAQAQDIIGDTYANFGDLDHEDKQRAIYSVSRDFGYEPEPKYEEWSLPGGESYSEVLLKLPQNGLTKGEQEQKMLLEATQRRGQLTHQQDMQLMKLQIKENRGSQDYQSRHWKDDPNVLAHIRMMDRYGGDNGNFSIMGTKKGKTQLLSSTGRSGTYEQAQQIAKAWEDKGYTTDIHQIGGDKRLLHIDEIQSDWHQEGRKSGYKNPTEKKLTGTVVNNSSQFGSSPDYMVQWSDGTFSGGYGSHEEAQKRLEEGKTDQKKFGVPDAPFKKNWHELALKHALVHAAKNGHDGLLITPGQSHADRFDLSKQVKNIYHSQNEDGTFHASVLAPNGQVLWEDFRAPPEKIEQYLGKDITSKIVGGVGDEEGGMRRLDPKDMKMGGEGMKGFYDKIVPDFLNKFGKKYDAKVQMNAHRVKGAREDYAKAVEQMGIAHIPMSELTPEQNQQIADRADTKLHYFPITPQMRESILKEGLPQYQRGGIIHKATGGQVLSIEQIKAEMLAKRTPVGLSQLQSIGVNEAPSLGIKAYVPPSGRPDNGMMPVGGVDTPRGNLPIGGIDMSQMQPGQQMMPSQPGQPPQGGPQGAPDGAPPAPGGPTPPMGNMLQMTPQGQALAAMRGPQPQAMADGGAVSQSPVTSLHDMIGSNMQNSLVPQPYQQNEQMMPGMNRVPVEDKLSSVDGSSMAPTDNFNPGTDGSYDHSTDGTVRYARGGSAKSPSVEQMKAELAAKDSDGSDDEEAKAPSKRITIEAEGPGGVHGIVVPHHMLHGRSWVSKKTGKKVVVPGMEEINKSRAQVYGSENRDPMTIGQIGRVHQQTLEEHFKKPLKEQLAAEQAATNKLRAAKHLGPKADTLDKSEKLDTVNHEHDSAGRTYVGFASKGVAGHALYTSGHGENMKRHVINTCPGQTAGCGGGTDEHGIVDTSKGTCFAPNAESQYVHAAVRRSTHEQAKHDPAMTRDWILAHTGSIRKAAEDGDKKNKVLLFRPNVVDETDVSSRHVIRHLNDQRRPKDKPLIVANSYGKTTELHDPENGYYVTHSNVGPKTKKGASISENIDRDQQRVRQTILGTKNKKGEDLVNVQGNKTPPKNSYMVTDVKRNSDFDGRMQKAIKYAKYWSTGRAEHELSESEKDEGPEGHFNGSGNPTTPKNAHYGHETHDGLRYDYQKQHILHPRLVQVGKNKDGTPHMIPTDSRFKDDEFLPKNRFKTKTGKVAGAILMTTPTESTSNVGHQTSFTHHVGEQHIEHALKNKGEYEIDHPKEQIKSAGKEYVPPQPINFMKKLAGGGSVTAHQHEDFDGHMAFPEQSFGAQHRLAYRHDPEESKEIGHLPYHAGARNIRAAFGSFNHRPKVAVHKDLDTMALELSRRMKAK